VRTRSTSRPAESSSPGLGAARFERSHVDRAHLAPERGRREPACGVEPARLVLGRGHTAEQPRLRPAEPAGREGGRDRWQPHERRVHVREVVQLAPGQPRTLARVVTRPHEPECLPRAPRHERTRHARESTTQGRTAAHELDEARVERLDQIGARVVARLRDDGGGHAGSVGTEGAFDGQPRRRV
jgi:hypothetical protein